MAEISKEFKRKFSELEEGHLEIREELNQLSMEDPSLEVKLQNKIDETEPWRKPIMDELWGIVKDFDREGLKNYHKFVDNSKYHELLNEAPYYNYIFSNRSPVWGFIGDGVMMDIIYRNDFEGNTPFGKFIHKQAVRCPTCQAVRNRKDYLVDEIKKSNGGKILSVAAGSARELQEVLTTDNSGNIYEMTALDHDINTYRQMMSEIDDPRFQFVIGDARKIAKGDYRVLIPRNVFLSSCNPRKDSKNMLKLFLKYRMDYIKQEGYSYSYSAGMTDYFDQETHGKKIGCDDIVKGIFDTSNYRTNIGNMNTDNPADVRFIMDVMCDWVLKYRTDSQMIAMASKIPESQIENMYLYKEPEGINSFLVIDKK